MQNNVTSMKTLKFILFALLIVSFQLAKAQSTTQTIVDGLLEPAYYGKPFVSEIHSTISKVELGYSKSYSEFNLLEENQKFERPVVVQRSPRCRRDSTGESIT